MLKNCEMWMSEIRFFFFFHVTCLDWILIINISRVWLILVALGYLMVINKYSPKWTWLVGLVYTAWIPKKVYFCQCTQKWVKGKMKLLMPILSLELLGGEQYLIIPTELANQCGQKAPFTTNIEWIISCYR